MVRFVAIVDPPEGWKYGFPAPLQKDYRQQLIDAGYPTKDLELALKYSWHSTIEVNTDD